jgi:hypothetical protein
MLKWIVKKLLRIVLDRPLPPPSSDERVFLTEFQTACRELPVLETHSALPSERIWLSNLNRLRELVLKEDPREFLRWDVVNSTMFIAFAHYISTERNYLKRRPDWNTRWRKAIKESCVGHPTPYLFYPASSGNLIHHAYHVAQFEEKTQVQIDQLDFVFEFGGGYGSMCRLFYNLGFRGSYVIFDLPLFSALQTYYLKTLALPVRSRTEFLKSRMAIVCLSDIQDLKTLLEDHLEAKNLFIATWSISETPVHLREIVLPLVSNFYSFLIAYQDRFEEVNNLEFFDQWQEAMRHVIWHNLRIQHIPGNHYLFGRAALS